MLRITVADLLATDIALTHAEAAALTLAVADALSKDETRLPPDTQIFLSSNGHVVVESDASTIKPDSRTLPGLTTQLAVLTRRLLQLDTRVAGDRRRRVPSELLATLARCVDRGDVPALSVAEFREALERFGGADTTMLAAIFWRAARQRTPAGNARAQTAEPQPGRTDPTDRRRHTPSPEELRRYLREIERELYEARSQVSATAQPAVPNVAPSSRVRQIGTALAAMVVGAALGTLAAFTMSGNVDVPNVLSSRPAVVATTEAPEPTVTHAAAENSAATPDHPQRADRIRISRSVQPLLLAAAIGTEVFSPSFSPRGHTLLFHAGRKAAPLMRASVTEAGEVGQVEKLLDDGAANYHVTMSPDGERIAYDSDREGVRAVFVANADGTAPRRVSGAGYAAIPSWSPDGARLAFVRAEPNHPRVWNVWIADIASGSLRRITRHEVGQPWGASWFPDGRRLAYSLEDRLLVADLETGMSTGYRTPVEGHLVRTPAVSPDGRKIVFQVQYDGVWLLDLDRVRMRRILTDATAEEFVWSPEGNAIAYHARTAGAYGLWRLALSGGAN